MARNPLQMRSAARAYPPEHFVFAANAGDTLAKKLLCRLLRHGVTKALIAELNAALNNVRLGIAATVGPKGVEIQATWIQEHVPNGTEGLYLAFGKFINSGLHEKLKRCDAEDCDNYHFRRGRWCSDRCGIRIRVRKLRGG